MKHATPPHVSLKISPVKCYPLSREYSDEKIEHLNDLDVDNYYNHIDTKDILINIKL